ncbi:MAG TPA: acyltransferase domain-containing protein [Clostridiales bacterium]|nr:acyltransferase domain-containing protein [Clostridiales bacterium]
MVPNSSYNICNYRDKKIQIKDIPENFNDLVKSLSIKNPPDIWLDKWEESQKTYPGLDAIDFIKNDFIIDANKYLQLPDEAVQAILVTLNIIRNNEELARLLWLSHYILFPSEIGVGIPDNLNNIKQHGVAFPDICIPQVNMDFLKGMFPAVLLLSGLLRLLRFYKERSIPEQVIIDTLSDVDIWMEDYYAKNGTWGLMEFWWLYNHFSGRLFRIGRLQFIYAGFKGNVRVFRNIRTGVVVSLSEVDIRYRADGQVDGTNDIYDRHGAWVSTLVVTDNSIKGNPISPLGFAENKVIELAKDEWREVLSKGSPVLDVHIATGSKLSHEACGESFKASVKFFERYFPELQFDGYMCTSWLLDPQLQCILPRESNIVKFQREFYLYPKKSDDFQTFERVFGNKPDNMKTLKAETSMQKAILDYVNKGNNMRQASMFLLKDDLQYWGQAFYQEQ